MAILEYFKWGGLLFTLILLPLNSKMAGAFWLALSILGLLSFKYGSNKGLNSFISSSKAWVFACLSAVMLIVVPQLYWGGSWGERHAEFRLLFGALGLLGLVQYADFTSTQLKWLGYALVLASWAAFGLMVLFGAEWAPTNKIPWGASMSLLVCVVLALALSPSSKLLQLRFFYASGVVAGVCAVLLSQSRGSYAIVFWVLGVVLWYFIKNSIKGLKIMSYVIGCTIAITLLTQIFPQIISIPSYRINQVANDFSAINNSKEAGLKTSVGIRLYIWKKAVKEVPDHVVLGVGREGRMASFKKWGVEADTPIIKSVGHLHNNYLAALFDFGLFGIASFMAYIVGLSYMFIRLRKDEETAALGMAGILFMHSVSSFSNVNFAHNYYPVLLSVSVSLCLLILLENKNPPSL